jgi:hypothetical protein
LVKVLLITPSCRRSCAARGRGDREANELARA